jgi:hypothetical protein
MGTIAKKMGSLTVKGLNDYQFLPAFAQPPHLGPLECGCSTRPATIMCITRRIRPALDRDFGGVLIAFDRLFGTFAGATGG